MTCLFADLAWLPRPAATFLERVKQLPQSSAAGRDLQAQAQYALTLNQLIRLAKALEQWRRKDPAALAPLIPFRLAILSNATLELIAPALVASAARHGIALEVILPPYDQIAQEALNPDGLVNSARPDAVLFALDHRALPMRLTPGDRAGADATVGGCLGYLRSLREAIAQHGGALSIFQTFAPPVEALFGSLDAALPGTRRQLIDEINRGLARQVVEQGDVLLDVAGIAGTVGLARWHDLPQWNLAKFSFSEALIPLYAEHLARIVAAIRGKSRKVLILDLDNTVWGGVIGDDGLDGIKLAQGDALGEAHLAVQSLALDLRRRGILLAVSSKNSDDIARAPFEHHPEMLLKLEHIAVFQANWNDKATNIQTIADTLSLGLDSMVFLDDNPVERGLIRQLLPQVAVPELPEEPAYYARTLAAAGYFEAVSLSTEDLRRASLYQDNAKRAEFKNAVDGVDAYLASLNMGITFSPFNTTSRARIVQLINKSNQFNLTTRRYTESEVAAAERDRSVFTLQVRLTDLFGDNGMISVLICRPQGCEEWAIDTWLMSCRVLGRKVEQMVLRELLRHASADGIRRLRGVYIPTARNRLVVDHYAKLGFRPLEALPDGTTHWEMRVDDAPPDAVPMTVISEFS